MSQQGEVLMKKILIVLAILGSISGYAEEESRVSLPERMEPSEQEIQSQREAYEQKRIKTAAAIEHQRVLDYIDRHDRD